MHDSNKNYPYCSFIVVNVLMVEAPGFEPGSDHFPRLHFYKLSPWLYRLASHGQLGSGCTFLNLEDRSEGDLRPHSQYMNPLASFWHQMPGRSLEPA